MAPAISLRIRSRLAGSVRRSFILASPPSWAQRGTAAPISPVPEAVYGYWSNPTSTPRALAASIRPRISTDLPHTGFPRAFRWETWTGSPAFSPISIASFTAATSPTV